MIISAWGFDRDTGFLGLEKQRFQGPAWILGASTVFGGTQICAFHVAFFKNCVTKFFVRILTYHFKMLLILHPYHIHNFWKLIPWVTAFWFSTQLDNPTTQISTCITIGTTNAAYVNRININFDGNLNNWITFKFNYMQYTMIMVVSYIVVYLMAISIDRSIACLSWR